MLNVAIVFFFLFEGLLVPVFRVVMIVNNFIVGNAALSMANRNVWSRGMVPIAAIAAATVVARRYWRYHLTPEVSLPYRENVDRLEMVMTWIGYSVGAMAVLVVMVLAFW
jgi:hypothetical protein